MAKVIPIKRKFIIEIGGQKKEIADPNPQMSEDEVRKLLTATYPELTNATINGPEIKNEVFVYTFKTSFAPKG